MNLYFDELDARYLSAPLWSGIDLDNLLRGVDARRGVAMFDDFVGFGGVLSTNTGQYFSGRNRWVSYQTASMLMTNVALTPTPATVSPTSLGAIVLAPATGVVDNDQNTLAWGANELTPYGTFPFAVIPGISNDLAFECRILVNTISNDIGDLFIGLAGAAGIQVAASVVPITATADTLATTLSLLGFHKLSGDGDKVDLAYERASGTVATKADVGTLVADTYIKAGFRYNGVEQTLTPWINGVEITASKVAKSVTGATPWANDYMAPVMASMQVDGTTAMKMTVDWIACAQLPPLK